MKEQQPIVHKKRNLTIGSAFRTGVSVGLGISFSSNFAQNHPEFMRDLNRALTNGYGDKDKAQTIVVPNPVFPTFVPTIEIVSTAQAIEPTEVAQIVPHIEWLSENKTEYGFNTHLRGDAQSGQNLDLTHFKHNVDLLKNAGQTWIRFDMREDQIIKMSSPTVINWNEHNLQTYDEAIEYARKQGLKIFIPVGIPNGITSGMTQTELEIFAHHFYGGLAGRYAGKVAVWQIANEADVHDFRSYDKIMREMPQDYLNAFAGVVQNGSDGIHQADPNALVTVNMSWWFGSGRNLESEGQRLFGAVVNSIDIITFDFYPDTSTANISKMPKIVADFSQKFGKPVIVGELGLPTASFSVKDQGHYMGLSVGALKGGLVTPRAVLMYELTDEANISGNEGSFGFLQTDGTPKPSWQQILPWLQEN